MCMRMCGGGACVCVLCVWVSVWGGEGVGVDEGGVSKRKKRR